MKKFVRILSVVLVALMLLVTLTACAAPSKNAEKAIKSLEKSGYTVVHDTKVLPGIFTFAGYDLTSVVTASKTVTDKNGEKKIEFLSIYYFADKETAEKALEKVETYASEDKAEDNTAESRWVAPTRSGNIVYYGTKAAVKAA